MMSFETVFTETFKHSFLISWDDGKQKWIAQCSILNIDLESNQYKELLAELVKEILLQNDQAFRFAEQHKTKL